MGGVGEFVLYVRSQPAEPKADMSDVQSSFARVFLFPLGTNNLLIDTFTGRRPKGADPPDASGTSPARGDEVPVEQARCARLALDLARRARIPLRVVDVARELAPRDVVETSDGEPPFYPILVRPDGAGLSGESDFIPGRVRAFLAGH